MDAVLFLPTRFLHPSTVPCLCSPLVRRLADKRDGGSQARRQQAKQEGASDEAHLWRKGGREKKNARVGLRRALQEEGRCAHAGWAHTHARAWEREG